MLTYCIVVTYNLLHTVEICSHIVYDFHTLCYIKFLAEFGEDEPDYEEPKPKAKRGGKRKNSRTGTGTPRKGKKKAIAKTDEELESIEEAHLEEADSVSTVDSTVDSQVDSVLDSETPNGLLNPTDKPEVSSNDDRTAEEQKSEEEPAVEAVLEEEAHSPVEEQAELSDEDKENGTETESEPKQDEIKQAEEFVMVDKEDIPVQASPMDEEVDDIALETTDTQPTKEPANESNEAADEPEVLPDFEEEDVDPDALQLDANVDMDDELNKVTFNS